MEPRGVGFVDGSEPVCSCAFCVFVAIGAYRLDHPFKVVARVRIPLGHF
jgi:hypothetical protein